MHHDNPDISLMKMLKNLISMAALTALLGCEHQEGKTGNIVSSATDRNLPVQSQSDDSQVTNVADSKAVIPSSGSVALISTNKQSQENQAGWESGGVIISGGYGVDDISLVYELPGDEGANSLPINSLTNGGSTNSLLP